MEAKPAVSSLLEPQAVLDLASSRRRSGVQKRKNAFSSPISVSSGPVKRHAREKATAASHTRVQNGPLTRARHVPSDLTSLDSQENPNLSTKNKAPAGVLGEVDAAVDEKGNKVEDFEAEIDAELDGLLSLDSNVHVVPNHCGWFKWTKIHYLEEHALPSFFSNASETRTPSVYLEIRNWIVKKFHSNTNSLIESEDLSELDVADLEAKQEVLEFLKLWGLVNFHPLSNIYSATHANGDTVFRDSLLGQLFLFDTIPPWPSLAPKANLSDQPLTSGLFPDSVLPEDLVRADGPTVEYHCNYCAADCSRKRYHCQKQADYDLCPDCFLNGKFDFDMKCSDFIVMEPAEATSVSGGKWTDQETLLLLEALELFEENWNEIAEHVATKTKAQCILHFIQMPIEDSFLFCDTEKNESSNEASYQEENIDKSSAAADTPTEINEGKLSGKENKSLECNVDVSKSEDASDAKVHFSALKEAQGSSENFALDALQEAFTAVGYLLTPESCLSFADVGNPVMALAAYLVRLVKHDVAAASARCSLKSLGSSAADMQLAARHCFILEDPPEERMEKFSLECMDPQTTDWGSKKGLNENESPIESIRTTSPFKEERTPACCSGFVHTENVPTASNCEVQEVEEPSLTDVSKSVEEASQLADSSKKIDVVSGFVPSEKNELEQSTSNTIGDDFSPSHHMETTNYAPPDNPTSMVLNQLATDEDQNGHENETNSWKDRTGEDNRSRIKRAAISALSAAAVMAKLLANQEEDQIRRLAACLIQKQMYKLEKKLSYFNEMENLVMKMKEQLEGSRQRLFHERAQIIASRLGLAASTTSRPVATVNLAHPMPRLPVASSSVQRPPLSRPAGAPALPADRLPPSLNAD